MFLCSRIFTISTFAQKKRLGIIQKGRRYLSSPAQFLWVLFLLVFWGLCYLPSRFTSWVSGAGLLSTSSASLVHYQTMAPTLLSFLKKKYVQPYRARIWFHLSCNSIVCGSLFIVRQLVSFACSLFLVRLACRVTDNLDEWPHHSCDRKTSRGNIQLFNLRHTIVKIKFLASNYALEVPSLMRMVPEKHFQGDTPSTLKVP